MRSCRLSLPPSLSRQRAAAATRRISNEPALLTTIGSAAFDTRAHVRFLSDAPPTPLAETMTMLATSAVVVGVHGVSAPLTPHLTSREPSVSAAQTIGLPVSTVRLVVVPTSSLSPTFVC
jgi:hypothetical protein